MLLDRRVYYLVCDSCGASGPYGTDGYDARRAAAEEGWTFSSWFNGLSYCRRDFCCDCSNKKEEEADES